MFHECFFIIITMIDFYALKFPSDDSVDYDGPVGVDDTSYLPPPSPYHKTSDDALPTAHGIVNDQCHDDETTPLPPPPTTGEYDYMNEIGNEEFQTTSKNNIRA